MPLSPETIIYRPLKTRVRRFKGQLYVANSEKGFELDEVSTLALRHVNGVRRISEIADEVASSYDVDPGVVTADLVELFEGLVIEGILTDKPVEAPVRRGEA